ncbi:hypothetical protein L9G15_00990 [Shewanella sp. A3A]|nr:hypothetical protein [Shewanella ferrihydritica]
MSPDYTKYSEQELADVFANIDKQKYAENYERLLAEFAVRQMSVDKATGEISMPEPAEVREVSSLLKFNPCSWQRVCAILVIGFGAGTPFVMNMSPGPIPASEEVAAVLLPLLVGGMLLHSFLFSWTIAKPSIVTLADDKMGFTIAQLFYSFILGMSVLSLILKQT